MRFMDLIKFYDFIQVLILKRSYSAKDEYFLSIINLLWFVHLQNKD
jgi:hypothetical protein